jgi:hypothetical protein
VAFFKQQSWYLPGVTEENFRQDFNQGPPEYEAGVLTTRLQRSVLVLKIYGSCNEHDAIKS